MADARLSYASELDEQTQKMFTKKYYKSFK
jgi:hypothetical protein